MDRALKSALYDLAANERILHAVGICLASIAWKGEPGNVEGIMNLADEIVDYITGDSGAKIPRPDLAGGKTDKAK